MLNAKHIPPQFTTARLIILNKNPCAIPTLDNLRPISAMGPVMKVLE